jgi:hypothetical protein
MNLDRELAEYILHFGGVIVITIAAIVIYRHYFTKSGLKASQDLSRIRSSMGSHDS